MKSQKILKTAPAVATSTHFLNIESEQIGDIIDYVRIIISDLMPLLSLIVAVGIGLIIIYAIINAIRG